MVPQIRATHREEPRKQDQVPWFLCQPGDDKGTTELRSSLAAGDSFVPKEASSDLGSPQTISGRLSLMEKARGWVRAHPVIWVIGAFIVGGIIGGAIGAAGESGLKDEKSDLEAQLARTQQERSSAEREAEAAVDRIAREKGRILAKARGEARSIVGEAKAEAEDLEGIEGEISAAEGELESVQSSLEGAEHEKSLSSFAAGIMKGEVDYTVGGTYEAPGGEGCYWALLNSANTSDIAANEFTVGAGQQIVTIETPYFTSNDCGTWKRIE